MALKVQHWFFGKTRSGCAVKLSESLTYAPSALKRHKTFVKIKQPSNSQLLSDAVDAEQGEVVDETVDSENTVAESTARRKLQWDCSKSAFDNFRANAFASQTLQRDLHSVAKARCTAKSRCGVSSRESKNVLRRKRLSKAGVSEQYIVDACWSRLLTGKEGNDSLAKTQRVVMPLSARGKAAGGERTRPKISSKVAKIFTTKAKKAARSLSPLAELNAAFSKPELSVHETDRTGKPLKKQRRKRADRKKEKENIINSGYLTARNRTSKSNFYFPISSPGTKSTRGKLVLNR